MGDPLIKTIHLLIQLCLLITLVGCKSEDKAPHFRDPIYLDIQKMMNAAESEVNAQTARVEKAQNSYNSAQIRTIDRVTTKNELIKAQEAQKKAEQLYEYYKVKLALREAEAKIAYKRAFTAGKEWPEPVEHESYQLQKKFRETSRNWRDRLPKPGESLVPEAIPGAEGEGGGGGH